MYFFRLGRGSVDAFFEVGVLFEGVVLMFSYGRCCVEGEGRLGEFAVGNRNFSLVILSCRFEF